MLSLQVEIFAESRFCATLSCSREEGYKKETIWSSQGVDTNSNPKSNFSPWKYHLKTLIYFLGNWLELTCNTTIDVNQFLDHRNTLLSAAVYKKLVDIYTVNKSTLEQPKVQTHKMQINAVQIEKTLYQKFVSVVRYLRPLAIFIFWSLRQESSKNNSFNLLTNHKCCNSKYIKSLIWIALNIYIGTYRQIKQGLKHINI